MSCTASSGSAGDVDGPLGDEHVGPEVAVGAGAPAVVHEVEEVVAPAALAPPPEGGVRQRRVAETADLRHGMRFADDSDRPVQAPEPGGPPAPLQRGRGDEPEHGRLVDDEADERGPHGHTAHEVLRAVDGVDDPAPGAVAGRLELLTLHGVARPGPLELRADELLGRAVGVGDRREVRLALDDEVVGPEARDRHPLDGVREDVGQTQVVVVGGHRVNLAPHAIGPEKVGRVAFTNVMPYAAELGPLTPQSF